MIKLYFSAGLAGALLLSGFAAGQTPSWNHNPNSRNGPPFWGAVTPSFATCGATPVFSQQFVEVGMTQTPIDIVSSKAVLEKIPSPTFQYDDTPLDVQNSGHVVQVNYAPGSYLHFGKAVTDLYQLTNFHFHVPSEHTIDGKRFDGEMHLNHVNMLGEQVIVTVFLTKSDNARSSIIDDIITRAPMTVTTNTGKGATVNAKSLLPGDRTFYTYNGSGSTPPCAEGVRRIVFAKAINVTPYVIQQLHTIVGAFPDYGGYANNNRPAMPLNGRTVVLVK